MTVLVALTPGERGTAALHLGTMMARSAQERVAVATVVPTPWPPSPFPGEAEYLRYAQRSAEQALSRARAQLGDELAADFVVHHSRSVSSGLLELASQRDASLVVLGSSSTGLLGRVGLSGVAERILHSTHVPVMLAPRGFVASGTRVTRVTVAFGPADERSNLLHRAAALADSLGATLRVATFASRPLATLAGGMEESAEDLVVRQWGQQLAAMIDASLAADSGDGALATQVDTVLGQGSSFADAVGAVPWAAGDLLVVGSSSSAISSFLLGSHASKIVRNSPVPVYLMPRAMRD
jgi:nucleotide-binding universal stress UspA family protein